MVWRENSRKRRASIQAKRRIFKPFSQSFSYMKTKRKSALYARMAFRNKRKTNKGERKREKKSNGKTYRRQTSKKNKTSAKSSFLALSHEPYKLLKAKNVGMAALLRARLWQRTCMFCHRAPAAPLRTRRSLTYHITQRVRHHINV